ncbi:MAG: LptF/LptG family permease [Phycisphaerae bacterium]|nr:LptF/LptG family permease [Phycisphaerae bacterium]
MSLLDRYIARQYVVNILTLLLIVASLIVAVDVVINLDRFTGRAEQLAQSGEGGSRGALHRTLLTGLLIADLWGPRLLQLFTYLNGVVLIAAMGFTCSHLVRHREFVAMLAGGISLHRAARPFLVVGAMMLCVQAVVQEVALPRVAHLLSRDAGDAGKRRLDAFPLHLTPDREGRLWYARSFDDDERALVDLAVWEHDSEGNLTRTIVAERASWDGTGWNLRGGLATRSVDGAAVQQKPEPIGRIESTLDPDRIKVRSLQGFTGTLSWGQITALLKTGADPQTLEQLDRTRWSRVASLLGSFLALWGAVSVFLVRAPKPMLKPALKAAPVALGGFAAAAVASSASIPGLPVWFGAFLPCVVLLSVAIALSTGVET